MTRLHPTVWLVWLGASAVLTMSARNPLYSLLLLLSARLTASLVGDGGDSDLPHLRFGAFILLFSALFNALFVHAGETILLRIPAGYPLVGGPITLEAVVAGAANGLLLWTLIGIFAAFNRLVAPDALVRLVPAGLRDTGVVLLIALTYMPATLAHSRRLREAQQIRGRQPAPDLLRAMRRAAAEWRPLLLALFVGGLERAFALAEALVARGYGYAPGMQESGRRRLWLVLTLGLTGGGWLAVAWGRAWGWLLLAAGVAALFVGVRRLSRHRVRTVYRPKLWTRRDLFAVAACVLGAVAVLLRRDVIFYSSLPRLSWPPFDPISGVALLLLLLPAALASRGAAR